MSNIIDVPMRKQRDLPTVTAEIRAYQDSARRMVINYSIEIGRRLVEAKSLVNHGEWGDYLREELGFSQSTANNHMRMFEAYGADQLTLTGAALKNQAFADLSYTQALALLALPSEEDRERFVQEHDMDELSTRELNEAIRAQTEAEDRANRLADEAKQLHTALEELRSEQAQTLEDAREKAAEVRKLQEQAKLLEARSTAKQAEAMEAKGETDKLKKQLQDAKAAEKKAKEKLKALRENPEIPEEILEKHRQEAEAAARSATAEEIRTKVTQAEEKLACAEKAAKEAEERAKAAEEQAAKARKELSMAAPELAVFAADFERVQRDIRDLVKRAAQMEGEPGENCRKAVLGLLDLVRKEAGEGNAEQ